MSLVKVRALIDGIAHGTKGDVVEYPKHFAEKLVKRGDAEFVKEEKKEVKPEPKKGKKK